MLGQEDTLEKEMATLSSILASFVKDKVSISSAQFTSVTQSCLTLCDPMNHSTPDLPVHHQLPEFTQTPAPNPSQHQSFPTSQLFA